MNNVDYFKKNKYVFVKNIVSEELIKFISQYALFDEIQDFKTDGGQVPNAHAKYGDSAMETLLLKMLPVIEENTGLELFPTYSFYRVYRTGDILEPHTDRESCEISATVCLDYNYDQSKYTWPIVIDGKKINMEPGDIVIYKGIVGEHSRELFSPPEENFHIQSFIHYVDKNGPFSEYKFDKRFGIGYNKDYKSYIVRTR